MNAPSPAAAEPSAQGIPSSAPIELFSARTVAARVAELASAIEKDFPRDGSMALVAIANGALVFASDLMRLIKLPMTVDIVRASSYEGASTSSSGRVVSTLSLKHCIQGKNVLLVDDILDSGRTLCHMTERLAPFAPASVKTCVLLDKPSRRAVPFKADYAGFEIQDLFVVGYGLDFNGYYRNLPYIGKLEAPL